VKSIQALAVMAAAMFSGTHAVAVPAAPARQLEVVAAAGPETRTAMFAGGCFWCMESEFEDIDGVLDVVSGYAGGSTPNPTYRQVSTGRTGHFEVIEVTYDLARVDYGQLLDIYWRNVDPTVDDRQFCDVGSHYRTAIFVNNAEEREAAERSKLAVQDDPRFAGVTIYTEIRDSSRFWRAEEEHQDFSKRNPTRYYSYRSGCGRDARLRQLWGEGPAEAQRGTR
jgi:peptide-methionine (S)-S-oxide reductase